MLHADLHGAIRIFDIGHHLDAALEAPTSSPMAFRFLPEYGPAGFKCCDCGAVRMFPMSGTVGGTGYAVVPGNQLCCYDCADKRQREDMRDRSRPFTAYISSDGARLTTWSGGTLGHVISHSSHCNNWGARIHCYSVRDVHGAYWHGRSSGPDMCISVRPSRGS